MAVNPDKTTVAIKLGSFIGGAVFLTVGVWKASAAFSDFRAEINANFRRLEVAMNVNQTDLQAQIDKKTADRWTSLDMRLWSYELEKENRPVTRQNGMGLIVPPVKPTN